MTTAKEGAMTKTPFCERCIVTEGHDLIFCPTHAAAPDLLAALERIVDVYGNDRSLEWIKDARAAIAKATA
jgi:hypothetical protein